jgi:CubicO group peptidase (beta-lactamase class C family)
MVKAVWAAAIALVLAGCAHKPAPPAPLVMQTPATLTLLAGATAAPEALRTRLTKLMAQHGVPGAQVAVINRGQLVWRADLGQADAARNRPVAPDTVFEVASLSKPIFALLVMDAVQRGALTLDQPLQALLPLDGLSDPRTSAITARQVLSHTSGLPNWRRMEPGGALNLAFAPGTGFRYSGEGYQYLARALGVATRRNDAGLEQLFQRRIGKPYGLQALQFVPDRAVLARRAQPHAAGKPIAFDTVVDRFGAAYSVHSTADDIARVLIGIMARNPALSAQSYATLLSPQKVPIPANDPQRALGLADWSLGFSVYQTPFGRFHVHGGSNTGFTSLMMMDDQRQWGFVILTNQDQAEPFMVSVFQALTQG